MLRYQIQAAFLATSLLTITQATADEMKYRAVIHVLTVSGAYNEATLPATDNGVKLAECELRRDAWLEQHKDAMAIADATMKAKGLSGYGMSITCERMN